MKIQFDEAQQVVREVFGSAPDNIDWPGGRDRKAFVATVGTRRFVFSRRGGPERARLEADILDRLGPAGLAPALIKLHGVWVVQSHVPGLRLSQHLADDIGREETAISAARSLARCQQLVGHAGLADRMPSIGMRSGWTGDFLLTAARLAEANGWPEPKLDLDRLENFLSSPPRTFVKWDARPGNALVHAETGRPVWIDWEHAGRRVAADDLCWLVCDEWFPADASLEDSTIAAFRDAQDQPIAYPFVRYVRTFGVFHMLIRADLILRQKGRRGWGNDARQMRFDLIGNSPERLSNLCDRGERWARLTPDTAVLGDLFSRMHALAAVRLE
ncbi:MAG: hypothetical protein RL093_336 [Pseudomonadota bacterium]|jgi:hypothetical protein